MMFRNPLARLHFIAYFLIGSSLVSAAEPTNLATLDDGEVVKAEVRAELGRNLLHPEKFGPFEKGFEKQGKEFFCGDREEARGVAQVVVLNQKTPRPIVASGWSKAEGVSGNDNADYAIYLDVTYMDGTMLYGQTAAFTVGTHDWERREVTVVPSKPIKSVAFYMLLRNHRGKAWFRRPALQMNETSGSVALFDGVPVTVRKSPKSGFQVRDVAAKSGFVAIRQNALGLTLASQTAKSNGAVFIDAELKDATGKDRAVTLTYAVAVAPQGLSWCESPRITTPVSHNAEYASAHHQGVGSNGRMSNYPLGAVIDSQRGRAVGIDMDKPAFYRIGYNAGTGELFLSYDLALTPEKPSAKVRFCLFGFEPAWGFRGALAQYYRIFPEAFVVRTPEQGLWMPFAAISKVKGFEDFGFKFKEGNDETAWDDQHKILTFRYTEPMTWWMAMDKKLPRTIEAAVAEAERLAATGNPYAKALLASGHHDRQGRLTAQLLDTPWCNGAVWSMNSMPGIAGDATDFKMKWNDAAKKAYEGPADRGGLDGEYIDSSEGYVTQILDYRRDHFAAAETPLTFNTVDLKPGVLRGLIAFEYIRAIARDVHAKGRLMMSNATPIALCWLTPLNDVLGTETDWAHKGVWQPMSDADLLYRRALCKGKPYCFLMNTQFEQFSHAMVEKYMKRSLAYGMFPGFFSPDAATGAYFTRPELYDRDRVLFKKYVPLCKRVAEAGWEPITLARSSEPKVYVERFGDQGPRYWTVFNDSGKPCSVTITWDGPAPKNAQDLVGSRPITWNGNAATLTLEAEDTAVIAAP